MVSKNDDVMSNTDPALLAGIDMDKEILNIDGTPIPLEDNPSGTFTVGQALIKALMGYYEDEKIDGDKKLDRYFLALQIKKGGIQELSPEQITELKTLVDKTFLSLVVAQVWLVLDPGLKKRKGY